MTDKKEKKEKKLSGVVVSDKMDQTVIVKIESYKKHPKYDKYIKKTKRVAAHNPDNFAKEGQKVEIRSVKPISKTKKFEIVR